MGRELIYMRGSISNVLIIFIGLGLILQYSDVSAQKESDGESPRAMVEQLSKEIRDIHARIAENPSASEVEKLRAKIQWNERRIKEISPDALSKIKTGDSKPRVPDLEYYMIIARKNLFTPLGSVREGKRQEFALTGILGRTALIQVIGDSRSYYVAEGESFANGARVTRIGKDTVTITHDGNEVNLKLGEGLPAGGPQGKTDKGSIQQKKTPGIDNRGRKKVVSSEEERLKREMKERMQEERENIKQKIGDLQRERDELKQAASEMEKRGQIDHDAYRRIEEIDRVVRELESNLR
jgi:predicted RNase H-like nuclease (RuvC/YqgF family)